MVASVGPGAPVSILLIDDEQLVAGTICRYLRREESSWTVHWVDTPQAGIDAALSGRFNVVVIDVRFPMGPSGFDVVRTLRRLGCDARILTLTGKSDIVDECELSAASGADAHLLKSGGPEDLRRQIRFALARPSSGWVFRSDELDLEFDLVTQRASVGGKPLAITPIRWRLLFRLARTPGEVISQEELWECAAVDSACRSGKALNKHMRALNAELDERSGATGPVITTVWGNGYALVPRSLSTTVGGGAPPLKRLWPTAIDFLPPSGK